MKNPIFWRRNMKKLILLGVLFTAVVFGNTDLEIEDSGILLKPDGAARHFEIKNSGNSFNDPAILPSYAGWGLLGSAGVPFFEIYGQTINETSDERIKEEIRDLPDLLSKVKNIRTVSYRRKDTNGRGVQTREIGFLAQNLKDSFPEIVSYDAKSDVYSVRYTRAVPVLFKAIQEQQKIIEQQAREIAEIKLKIGL
jgi:hypothetical protein